MLQNGKTANTLSTARGAAYELEKACDLKKAGEKVLGFGRKLGSREFDVETATKLIECKNIDWLKLVGKPEGSCHQAIDLSCRY